MVDLIQFGNVELRTENGSNGFITREMTTAFTLSETLLS